MSASSKIEWTDTTWNPVRGCSKVSEGCRNCYAMHIAARFSGAGQPYEGLAKRDPVNWTGKVRLVPENLDAPLKWRKPRRVFVNSMSDLFHESLSDADILKVFNVMRQCTWAGGQGCGRIGGVGHTFQVLTKRPKRMRDFVSRLRWTGEELKLDGRLPNAACHPMHLGMGRQIWLGVSVEDRATADERIPLLLHTPAAVRFISYEPALEAVDVTPWMYGDSRLNWVVAGGESGPGARPCNIEWIRSIVDQCRTAQVKCFVKQLGAKPHCTIGKHHRHPTWVSWLNLKDRKGGDPAEWPADLRVREFPEQTP